jgi:hypothetical protein
MLALQTLFQREYEEAVNKGDLLEQRRICEIAVFFLICYCCSMRGFEAPKIVLHTLRGKIQLADSEDAPAHLAIPLRGRFKARSQEVSNLFLYTAARTASGLEPGLWVSRLVDCLASLGIRSGWLFQNPDGSPRKLNSFGEEFFSHLLAIRDEDFLLFEPDLDILEAYGLARSCRRGATTRATNAGVSEPDINWINRWNTGDQEIINGPMAVIYAKQKQMLQTFLRFSTAL